MFKISWFYDDFWYSFVPVILYWKLLLRRLYLIHLWFSSSPLRPSLPTSLRLHVCMHCSLLSYNTPREGNSHVWSSLRWRSAYKEGVRMISSPRWGIYPLEIRINDLSVEYLLIVWHLDIFCYCLRTSLIMILTQRHWENKYISSY